MSNPETTLTFKDTDSGDDASVIVRHHANCVSLAVSLRSNGDIEVCIPKDVARRIAEAISRPQP